MADRFRSYLRWVLVGMVLGQLLSVDVDSEASLGLTAGVIVAAVIVAALDVGFVVWGRVAERRRPCGCVRCTDARLVRATDWAPRGMIVCGSCGNKRCPHASDHRLGCTGSNAPGQPGSVYG